MEITVEEYLNLGLLDISGYHQPGATFTVLADGDKVCVDSKGLNCNGISWLSKEQRLKLLPLVLVKVFCLQQKINILEDVVSKVKDDIGKTWLYLEDNE